MGTHIEALKKYAKKKSDCSKKRPNEECKLKTIVKNQILRLIKILKTFAMKIFDCSKKGSG